MQPPNQHQALTFFVWAPLTCLRSPGTAVHFRGTSVCPSPAPQGLRAVSTSGAQTPFSFYVLSQPKPLQRLPHPSGSKSAPAGRSFSEVAPFPLYLHPQPHFPPIHYLPATILCSRPHSCLRALAHALPSAWNVLSCMSIGFTCCGGLYSDTTSSVAPTQPPPPLWHFNHNPASILVCSRF